MLKLNRAVARASRPARSSPSGPGLMAAPRLAPPPAGPHPARRASARYQGEEAPVREREADVMTGIVFRPFEEMQVQLSALDKVLDSGHIQVSYARLNYDEALEAAVNEQINVEYNLSYVYHSVSAYFDRDNVGLPGFAAYFRHQSDEEREHASKLMRHQSQRGGRVALRPILGPQSEFFHPTKGDALYAAEVALSLEKLNFQKLRDLHTLAEEAGDADLQHFIEDNLLAEQVADVKEAAVFVSRLRRAGQGHGTVHIDLQLQRDYFGQDCVVG